MKSYTDLEQSKILTEILPLESADMCWCLATKGNPKAMFNEGYNKYGDFELPCWSLASLLGIIPNYKLNSEHNYHTCTAETSFGKETVAWFDNPINACYEMILKLHELNLL